MQVKTAIKIPSHSPFIELLKWVKVLQANKAGSASKTGSANLFRSPSQGVTLNTLLPFYRWQNEKLSLTTRLATLTEQATKLQEVPVRKRILSGLPLFTQIPKAAHNNAPRPHPSDKLWAQWENMARDVLRMTATTYLCFIGDPKMEHYVLPPMQEQIENVFALTVALAKSIELHRLKAINRGLLPEMGEQENLVKKEDLQLLERHSKMDRQLTHNRKWGWKGGRGKGKGFHPYSSFQSNYGRGKGKGKGGRGNSQFKFGADKDKSE